MDNNGIVYTVPSCSLYLCSEGETAWGAKKDNIKLQVQRVPKARDEGEAVVDDDVNVQSFLLIIEQDKTLQSLELVATLDMAIINPNFLFIQQGIARFGLQMTGAGICDALLEILNSEIRLSVFGFKRHQHKQQYQLKNKMAQLEITHEEIQTQEEKYFGYYESFTHQQLMLEDSLRTGAYHKAIVGNKPQFQGKVVMDVGAGTGILSFFAAASGARCVYAVEASRMAKMCSKLVAANDMQDVIKVVHGKVEEVSVDDQVDVLVSEPMGFLLLNEQMVQSYIAARDRFLKPEGLMYPRSSRIFVAPYSNRSLWEERNAPAKFWQKTNFYGVDMSVLKDIALDHYISQVIFDSCQLEHIMIPVAQAAVIDLNLKTISLSELDLVETHFSFKIASDGVCHGLCCWFDVSMGENPLVVLTTAPDAPTTCWYQVVCLLHSPKVVRKDVPLKGSFKMIANNRRSYDIHIHFDDDDEDQIHISYLHDAIYRYCNTHK